MNHHPGLYGSPKSWMQCSDLCDDAVLFFFSLTHTHTPNLVHFESFLIEYLAALAFSAVAVALGGLRGIVPDRAASGAITEQAPDCSLLPSSSLPCLFCVCCSRRVERAAYKCSHILFRTQCSS